MANPVRKCIACSGEDDHPKDQLVTGDSSVFHHHDCGAFFMDPPCPSCAWVAKHKGDLRGEDWRAHVIDMHSQLTQEQREQAPWDRDVVKSHLNGKVAG